MTQWICKAFITLALACSASPVFAVCEDTSKQGEQTLCEELRQLLAPWDSDKAPGVAVSVMLDGKTVFNEGFGIANLEYDVPITGKTSFHIASVSKQFTAFAALMLVSEGRISLDDDIRKHLPEMRDTGHVITVRHLLDHTSGLRDESSLLAMAGWYNDDVMTNAQAYRLVSGQAGLNFVPGEKFEYNNSNYFLLARIIAKVSGQPFAEFMQKRIFTPLDMQGTTIHEDSSITVKNRAYSYYPRGNGFAKASLNTGITGSTGVQTTSVDLLKWARNFETQTVGDPEVFAHMKQRSRLPDGTDATLARGQELRHYKGMDSWVHGGRIGGYRSFLIRIPSERLAVSVISNRSDFDMAKIAFSVADIILRDRPAFSAPPATAWQKATSELLEEFTGSYELFKGIIFSFTADGENLLFSPPGSNAKIPLEQVGPRRFMLNAAQNNSIEFAPGRSGQSPSLTYILSLNGKLKAPRIQPLPFDADNVKLDEFTGSYFSEELQTRYKFRVQDGALTAAHVRLPSITMTPFQPDRFISPESAHFQNVEFVRDDAGAIIGCKISGAVANNVWFGRQTD
ncbi:serine hydrolase domain-containing protein [Sphingorhabdus sp. Alg239-R122]|uniref:serine hydrolase domain-containing protein n=1 Tax=Sphingorhabdus sp. Alg239-R122 TaxID=2305989 RepID=UPI0013DA25B6|nr:serine hydrolase domain-containing protein [Sphingorhabdus sp. Alg239-R122]